MTKPGGEAGAPQTAGDAVSSGHIRLPGERYGDYELIKPLATGGMADIFLARKLGVQGFQKLVVIKRIRRELVKEHGLIDMFVDEAHVAAKLDHPNIVVITDLGEHEDSFYMAMEYLRGQTLRQLQAKLSDLNKMLPPQFWVRIMDFALDGLHFAHELVNDDGMPLGLVHRDFTPSNIMITYSGVVKVIDFGVAHVEGPQRHETRIGSIKGKICYLAPEQCMAQPVDRRADVFAAGIVLWELLSRKRLFDGPSDAAIIVSIIKDDIPLPGWDGQPLDQELVEIVMKALERDPARRFQSAAEMREALRGYLRSKHEKVDASDIADVMCKLFEKERLADDKLVTRSALPPTEPSSRSGSHRGKTPSGSGQARLPAGREPISASGGSSSARGQVDNITQPSPTQEPRRRVGIWIGMALVLLVAGGVGAWRTLGAAPPVHPAVVVNEQPKPPKEEAPPPKEEAPKPPKEEAPPPKEETPPKPPKEEAPPPKEEAHTPHAPKTTAPSSGWGYLDFDTRPYTAVFIGRKKVGDTPMLNVKVPAGKLTLTLVNEEAGIHETYTVTVPKDGRVFKKLKL